MEEQFDSSKLEVKLLPWLIKADYTWEGLTGGGFFWFHRPMDYKMEKEECCFVCFKNCHNTQQKIVKYLYVQVDEVGSDL